MSMWMPTDRPTHRISTRHQVRHQLPASWSWLLGCARQNAGATISKPQPVPVGGWKAELGKKARQSQVQCSTLQSPILKHLFVRIGLVSLSTPQHPHPASTLEPPNPNPHFCTTTSLSSQDLLGFDCIQAGDWDLMRWDLYLGQDPA